MPLCIYSKAVLKKNNSAVFFFLLGATVFGLYAQEIQVNSVRRNGGIFLLDCRILLDDTGQLITALDAGDTVMVGIRLNQSSSDYFFFSSKAEYYEYQRRIRWDPIERLYVIEEPGELDGIFSTGKPFLKPCWTIMSCRYRCPAKNTASACGGRSSGRYLCRPSIYSDPFFRIYIP